MFRKNTLERSEGREVRKDEGRIILACSSRKLGDSPGYHLEQCQKPGNKIRYTEILELFVVRRLILSYRECIQK